MMMVAVLGPDPILILRPVTVSSGPHTHTHTRARTLLAFSITPSHHIPIIFCVESGVTGLFIHHKQFMSHIYHTKLDLCFPACTCVNIFV